MKHLMKCPSCMNYTLKDVCGKCGLKTVSPRPVKFSMEDKYGDYRRENKKKEWEKEGKY